jgi:hypothetical protein
MRITRKTGVLVGNKVIAAKDEQRARQIHETKLQTMRPSVDNAPPAHFGGMKVNRKRAQLEEGKNIAPVCGPRWHLSVNLL